LWRENSLMHLTFQILSSVPQLACNRRPMHSTPSMLASRVYTCKQYRLDKFIYY
jgi:hypothetical protein